MSRRFSDIRRAPLLAQALSNYQAYEARDLAERGQNIGTKGPASPALYVAITPFTLSLAAGDSYKCRTTTRNHNQLSSYLSTYSSTTLTNATKNGEFKPATVRLFVKTGSTVSTSKITGIRYLKSNGNSYSHPFGASSGTDKEYEVFEGIATALQAASANNHVTYTPEKFQLGE
jgi:hypothetical protein